MTDVPKKRIEWKTATEAEQSRAVAEELGWTHLMPAGFFAWQFYGTPPGGKPGMAFGDTHVTGDYLHNPADWWPLVEEKKGKVEYMDPPGQHPWYVEMPELDRVAYGHASTPGEAACIAYLRARGWEIVTCPG